MFGLFSSSIILRPVIPPSPPPSIHPSSILSRPSSWCIWVRTRVCVCVQPYVDELDALLRDDECCPNECAYNKQPIDAGSHSASPPTSTPLSTQSTCEHTRIDTQRKMWRIIKKWLSEDRSFQSFTQSASDSLEVQMLSETNIHHWRTSHTLITQGHTSEGTYVM